MPEPAIRVGVDIEAVSRFECSGSDIFTANELEQARAHANPVETLAGRWCAKEAVVKALSDTVLLSPREVEVVTDSGGRPRAVLPERARRYVLDLDVSIAHSAGFAVAAATAAVKTDTVPDEIAAGPGRSQPAVEGDAT